MSFKKMRKSALDVTLNSVSYRLLSDDTSRGLNRGVRITSGPVRASNNVYTAVLGDASSPEVKEVVVKLATTLEQLDGLRREASFYEKELKPLQGSVVPKYYGFYERQPDVLIVGCLILEKLNDVQTSIDVMEFSRQALLGICKLHQAGVYHGKLNGTRDVLCTLEGPRIVDFTKAFRHQCVGCTPQLVTYCGVTIDNSGCVELAQAEKIYGCLETFEGIDHRKKEEEKAIRMQMRMANQWVQQSQGFQANAVAMNARPFHH